MAISLPPGTSNFNQTGSLTFRVTPIYLNSSAPSVKYSLRMWGIPQQIRMQHSNSKPNTQQIPPITTPQSSYIKIFRITTTLQKLTQYFRDMSIIIISIIDERNNKQIGHAYIKIKIYIINNLLSQFCQKIQVISINSTQFKKYVIGEILFQCLVNVPINIISSPRQKCINQEQIPQDNKQKRTKSQSSSARYIKKQSIHLTNQEHHMSENYSQGLIKQPEPTKINQQARIKNDQDKDHQIKDILYALKQRPRTGENIMNYIEEDSIDFYPTIEQLIKKYGPNNICVQRMRLKLDQAKYLMYTRQNTNIKQHFLNQGYLLTFNHTNFIVLSNGGFNDVLVMQKVSDKDQNVVNQVLLKKLGEGGLFVKDLIPGNVIEIENSAYKGKCVIRKVNLQGQPAKILIRRKDNNKKVAQTELIIEPLSAGKAKQQKAVQQHEKHQSRHSQPEQIKKIHYYISLSPTSQNIKKQYKVLLHPQCQKQAAKGKKMIFTALNVPQLVKITTWTQNNEDLKEFSIMFDPSITMKQQILDNGEEKFKVFMASADCIENLMSIVVAYDTTSTKQIPQHSERKSQNDPHTTVDQKTTKQYLKQDKLKLLLQCFQKLQSTTNSECMEFINKLLSPTIIHNQQPVLFQKVCALAGVMQPEIVAKIAFQELLHGEFSMFWSCFLQYRRWNQLYIHSLIISQQSLYRNLLLSQKDHQTQKQHKKKMQKLINKLTRSKSTLFGLIPLSACRDVISQFISNLFSLQNHQLQDSKNDKLNKKQQKILKIQENFNNILDLLCRYIGSDGVTHCIRIEQLALILLNDLQQGKISINDHQILAIVIQSNNEMELLFQVVISCIEWKDGVNGCRNFKKIVKQMEKIESQRSKIQSQKQFKIHIQQQKKIHPYQIESKYPSNLIPQSNFSNREMPEQYLNSQLLQNNNNVIIYMTQLILNQNRLASTARPQQTRLQVFDIDSKELKGNFTLDKLPKPLKLVQSRDYRVVIQLKQSQRVQLLEGVFIANDKLQKVLIYGNKTQEVGVIRITLNPDQFQKQQRSFQQDFIALEMKKQYQLFQNQNNIDNNIIMLQQKSKQKQQQERIALTKEQHISLLKDDILLYKILSIFPIPKPNEQCLIQIEGAEYLVRYPFKHVMGKITNNNKDQLYLNINFKIQGMISQELNQKLYKSKGTHEICFNKLDGTLGGLVTIELGEYIGQQLEEEIQGDKGVQKVILLNIYHMQTFFKLDQEQNNINSQMKIVITSQSNSQPAFIKQIKFNSVRSQLGNQVQPLRHVWIGVSERVPISKKFDICIYNKSKDNIERLLGHFQCKIKYHISQIGIFENKGYLVDQKGYRLAINMIQINYNDLFCKDQIGRQKFQNLLQIFQVENMLKIHKIKPTTNKQLEEQIKNNFGFNNTQLHLLLELQQKEDQLLNMINYWDIDQLFLRQQIDLQNYSIYDLFTEFQLYDFTHSGVIPLSKANLVDIIVFKNKENLHRINMQKCMVNNKDGWIIDIKSPQPNLQIDYILLLWNLRRFTKIDGYFYSQQLANNCQKHINQTTKNENNTLIQNSSIQKKRQIQIQLLGYKNIKINNEPGTLIFYINGQKIAQPIPRCYTYQYFNINKIYTFYPVVLEIYNKKYGGKYIFYQELVTTVNVQEEVVSVLGGEIYFRIGGQSRDTSMQNPKTNKKFYENEYKYPPKQDNKKSIPQKQLKQSRKQRWNNIKQYTNDTRKIADILTSKIPV